MTWIETMLDKYGSEEAVKEEMKRRSELSSKNRGKKGGFAALNKRERRAISKMAANKRWGNTNESQETANG